MSPGIEPNNAKSFKSLGLALRLEFQMEFQAQGLISGLEGSDFGKNVCRHSLVCPICDCDCLATECFGRKAIRQNKRSPFRWGTLERKPNEQSDLEKNVCRHSLVCPICDCDCLATECFGRKAIRPNKQSNFGKNVCRHSLVSPICDCDVLATSCFGSKAIFGETVTNTRPNLNFSGLGWGPVPGIYRFWPQIF